jgi:hypothetical protein
MGGTGMIEINKTYTTRAGDVVRNLTRLNNPTWPIAGIIVHENGFESAETWTEDGAFMYGSKTGRTDLVPVSTKHEGFVCVQADTGEMRGPVFATGKEAADYNDKFAAYRPFGMVVAHVTWED